MENSWQKRDYYVILALLVFWPIGILWMWKGTNWRKWVKTLITILFIISVIPTIFIWTLFFGTKVQESVNPAKVNVSQLYNCAPLNADWSKCKNLKYNFSFEYPAKWNYEDQFGTSLIVGPSIDNLDRAFIFEVDANLNDTAEIAQGEAQGMPDEAKRTVTITNGLYHSTGYTILPNGGLNWKSSLLDGNAVYTIKTKYGLKSNAIGVDEATLRSIFEHMAGSLKKE